MGKALAQLWAFVTTLFTALERSAKIVDNLAIVGEEMSVVQVDRSRHERTKQRAILDKEMRAWEADQALLPAPESSGS